MPFFTPDAYPESDIDAVWPTRSRFNKVLRGFKFV
ncbi:hypothetical protein EPIR_3271 [Erwinia piriflorinigrans CFBP 5888]|uniref:Uncharacterized protein n=1 Tax=Erwinia piriflorinigrans CFBP 5888 TaxID=1161919 RepID=V5ZCF9_9GAMM|nr:hypothetical protein EPIR_3271 [Erwinia piriflorinigrans CFBP 5888]